MDDIADVEYIVAQLSRDKIDELALERLHTTIGEACCAMFKELRQSYSHVPWGDIISMRNILVHEYYKVKKKTIWDVAENKIPVLKNRIQSILNDLGAYS